ncbi:MAG: DUF2961 domain-containing protein [Clostridia bacterium]|nr:DUF2961 domain-containing protein [Clostridia bacterium]
MSNYFSDMFRLTRKCDAVSRSISAENFKGEKGKGGMSTDGAATNAARDLGQGWKVSPYVRIGAGETFEMANIEDMGIIKHIWLTHSEKMVRSFILRIYYEGSDTPSVEAPLDDFFCNTDNSFAQVSSLAICVNPARGLNCYFEMPFRKQCRMTIENISKDEICLYYQVDYVLCEVPEDCLYFHAQYRRQNPVHYKDVYTILDNVQGNGHYVGTYMYWGQNNNGWWGEGEIKFYLDGDKEFPTICGTGTEDYFCGAYNFDVQGRYTEFTTPYAGMPKVIRPDGLYKANERFALYRWHIVDPIYFKEDIKVTMQDLGWRSGGRYLPRQDDISSVCYWYQDSICKTFPKFPSKDELELI